MRLSTLDEAISELSRLTNYERTRPDGPRDFNLDRTRHLLKRLGNPHEALGARVVQIGGSKGKGSTTLLLDAIYGAAQKKTGRFMSPHLESPLERIAVNGSPISAKDFARRVGEVVAAVDGEMTFFEALLAAACLHFAYCGTEVALLEVGLGGRLDATTVVPTTQSIITEISHEHTEILGDTLEAIAADKAGILRPGVPCWCGVDPESAAGIVIAQEAEQVGAPLVSVRPPSCHAAGVEGVIFDDLLLPVLGRHQARNAALAAAACHDVELGDVRRGLAEAKLPGRCEFLSGVVLDSAHNVSSIRATLDAIADHFPRHTPTLLFALAQDKDLDAIAPLLGKRCSNVVCTRADERRGMEAHRLAAHPAWAGRAREVPQPVAALERARELAGSDGLLLVTGSFYLAGTLRPWLTPPPI